MAGAALLLLLLAGFSVSAVVVVVLIIIRRSQPGLDWSGPWKKATATVFNSYPACCRDAPNYDPRADKTECSDNSGCKWMGQLAALEGKQSFDWVKSTDIAAFFELGQTEGSWADKWKNKKLGIRNPKTGKTMVVTVLDRCYDGDCRGCCSANAKQYGNNTVVDLEYYTSERFWGPGKFSGMEPIEWKCLNC